VPVPLSLLLGFSFGVLLAWVSRDELAREEGPLVLSRPVLVASAFALCVYAPIVGYFALFHGDWFYLYLYPHARIPSAVDLALVLVSGLLVPLGTAVSVPAARSKKVAVVAQLGSIPAVIAAGVILWGARRLAVSASYTQFHGGFGTLPLFGSPLGRGVLFMGVVGALGCAWSVKIARKR
jgi:hypothetical protein